MSEPATVDTRLAAQAAAIEAKAARMQAAAIKPLPGPMLDAFDPLPSPTALKYGLEIRQPVASDFILFQRLESPLLKLGEPDLMIAQEQACEIIWQLTHPVEEARRVFRLGRDAFTEAAMVSVADRVHPVDLQKLFAEVRDNYIGWLSTVVEYEEPPKEGEVKRDFCQPPVETGSAGGSTTQRNL